MCGRTTIPGGSYCKTCSTKKSIAGGAQSAVPKAAASIGVPASQATAKMELKCYKYTKTIFRTDKGLLVVQIPGGKYGVLAVDRNEDANATSLTEADHAEATALGLSVVSSGNPQQIQKICRVLTIDGQNHLPDAEIEQIRKNVEEVNAASAPAPSLSLSTGAIPSISGASGMVPTLSMTAPVTSSTPSASTEVVEKAPLAMPPAPQIPAAAPLPSVMPPAAPPAVLQTSLQPAAPQEPAAPQLPAASALPVMPSVLGLDVSSILSASK